MALKTGGWLSGLILAAATLIGCAIAPISPTPPAARSQQGSVDLASLPADGQAVPAGEDSLTNSGASRDAKSKPPETSDAPCDKSSEPGQKGQPSGRSYAGSPGEVSGEASLPIPDRSDIRKLVIQFSVRKRASLTEGLRRAGRYLPMMKKVFASEGLPADLAYVPLVESHYHNGAVSPAGAVGLWQFIDSTARLSGLRVDFWVDERLDPEKATHAAVRHLKELYNQFGEWDLVFAAYNAGAGAVSRALERAKAQDFWAIDAKRLLQTETLHYVRKLYAAMVIARDPAAYGLEAESAERPLRYGTIRIKGPMDLPTIARVARLPLRVLRNLNPALRRGCTPPGERHYTLRVPPGTENVVRDRLATIPANQRPTLVRHRVGIRESLWHIAKHYGVRADAIAEMNDIDDPSSLQSGQELVVAVRSPDSESGSIETAHSGIDKIKEQGRRIYRVRAGDTVWAISQAYGVPMEALLRWNGLTSDARIWPGDRLIVDPEVSLAPLEDPWRQMRVTRNGEGSWAISKQHNRSAPVRRSAATPSRVTTCSTRARCTPSIPVGAVVRLRISER